jgi:acyl-CoA synthetase (AMP-forming)/AMP-acid ligase II
VLHDEAAAEEVSYAEMFERVRKAAGALRNAGVARGDRVLIVLPTGVGFFLSFFGLQLVGAVPVPATPPGRLEKVDVTMTRLRHIALGAGIACVITTEELRPRFEELRSDIPTLRAVLTPDLLTGDGALPAADVEAELNAVSPQALAFLQYTSGSTGNPKGVAISHAQLRANACAFGDHLGVGPVDTVVSWLPLYHDMGLIGVLCGGVIVGFGQILLSPLFFLLRPRRWLEAVTQYRATITVAPNFGYAYAVKRVPEKARAGLDLSSIRIALSGAEPVNIGTIRSFIDAFQSYGFCPDAIRPTYGLAEATLAVTMRRGARPLRTRSVDRFALSDGRVAEATSESSSTTVVSCGEPVPGAEVRILGEHGQELGPLSVGHIVVRSPSVMVGYFGNQRATDEVLRDGWLWTGDLGFLDDGELFVTGRVKDLIILDGRNHYSEDVERVAETVEGIAPGGTIAFSIYDETTARDDVIIVVETSLKTAAERVALQEAVKDKVASDCRIVLADVVLVPLRALPKTSSGKKQRGLTKERHRTGMLVRRPRVVDS